MNENLQLYRGKRVLITGHTGFKGVWLTSILNGLGAKVSGYALDPETSPSHFDLLKPSIQEIRSDIRDVNSLYKFIDQIEPNLIFHLAAQPLVLESYSNPFETWDINLRGTQNLLEYARTRTKQSLVVVTTDKVYSNSTNERIKNEDSKLGGFDPYSASKAATEILVDSYRSSYFGEKNGSFVATARGGNVIGGGDWSKNRLIVDVIKAWQSGEKLILRNPNATRPWQHVLDCLYGYLLLGAKSLQKDFFYAQAWNFGPISQDELSVSTIVKFMQNKLETLSFESSQSSEVELHETEKLMISSELSNDKLKWKPRLKPIDSINLTLEWYVNFYKKNIIYTEHQIKEYFKNG